MRLRKNMKRAAAAALALSMALSAAMPASAGTYYIDKGDITVTVTEDGTTYVKHSGKENYENEFGDLDNGDITIKGSEDPGEQTGNNSDGSAGDDTADEAVKQKPVVDAEPGEPAEETDTELVVWPDNVNSGEAQEKDGLEPADAEPKTPDTPDTQKPEGKTDDDTLEASTEQKPVEKAAEDEDDDKDVMTFEDNTASTVTKTVNEAVKHIITIMNNCTKKDTTVTIKDVNIDVSRSYDAAMWVVGEGDTTLKLEGNNTLKGGLNRAGLEKDDEGSTGKLTITAEDTSSSLNAYGGIRGAGIGGGTQQSTSKLEIANGKIHAVGGNFGAGIGGGYCGDGEVSISGGEVTAQGGLYAAGIGGGAAGSGKVTIKNGEVTAKGGKGNSNGGAGAAIGTGGDADGTAGKELDVNVSGGGTVTRIDSNSPADYKHEWTLVSSTPAAVGQQGKKVYECSCGSTRTVYEPALPAPVEEEQNGRNAYAALTVEGAAYEMHQESARCIVTADSDTATLFGCLGNLAELKAQGVDTLVFRTESRETALDIDTMLSLGAEDTLFTLTHSGSSATLTVGGADHSELIH